MWCIGPTPPLENNKKNITLIQVGSAERMEQVNNTHKENGSALNACLVLLPSTCLNVQQLNMKCGIQNMSSAVPHLPNT